MSIEQPNVVDAIGIDDPSGDVVLTITDHLEWGDDGKDHLLLLQEKINTYLRFVESGELLESYPAAEGRNAVISVVAKYPPNKDAKEFFDQAASIVSNAGIGLRFEHFDG